MFGFLFGTICLVSLIAMAKQGRRHRFGSPWGYRRDWGYACGPPDHGGYGCAGGSRYHADDEDDGGGGPYRRRGRGHRGRRGPFGGRFQSRFLGFLFDELQTSPSQEQVVREVAEELFDKRKTLKKTASQLRENLGAAFRDSDLDVDKLGSAFSQYDELVQEARDTITDALTKVHTVLDDEQRRRLARFIERGFAR